MIQQIRDAIRAHWPDHLDCEERYENPLVWDDEMGVVCSCTTILGMPGGGDASPPPETEEAPASPEEEQGWEAAALAGIAENPAAQVYAQGYQAGEKAGGATTVDRYGREGSAGPGMAEVNVSLAHDPMGTALGVIDPSLPYGPADVERHLVDIAARLERGVHFERQWAQRRFTATLAFDRAYNRAVVATDGGAADQRKSQAMVDCEELYEAKLMADFMAKAVADTMHNLRSLQTNYQTISRSVGSSLHGPNTRT